MCDSTGFLVRHRAFKGILGRRMLRWGVASFSPLLSCKDSFSLQTHTTYFHFHCRYYREDKEQFSLFHEVLCSALSSLLPWQGNSDCDSMKMSATLNFVSSVSHIYLMRVSKSKSRMMKNQRGKAENKQWRDIHVAWLFPGRKDLAHTQKRKPSLPVSITISLILFPSTWCNLYMFKN